MRNIATKVDGSTNLSASDFNSLQDELENVVTSTGQSLDPAGGPDTDLNMLGQAAADYANAAWGYDDGGAADAYVLSRSTTLKSPTAYFDNMIVAFTPGNTNTGASTINVVTLGNKNIKILGSDPVAGDIVAGKEIIMKYDGTNFEIIAGERPLDEDTMTSDSAFRAPTQQSVKAYVDNTVKSFGAWDAGAPWAKATAYQAATDGFVLVYIASGATGVVTGKTDGSNPPTTIVIADDEGGAGGSEGLCFPVRKNDYWQVDTAATPTIRWLPLS